jgi:predicted kinase
MEQFLLQMTGEPGTGKSTLARAIGKETGAVVLDKDILKSRLLEGEPEEGLAGLPEEIASPMHHAMLMDLAASILAQGFSVILDSTAFYPIIRRKGRETAQEAVVKYYIIECVLPELDKLQERIDGKDLMPSHVDTATDEGYLKPGAAEILEPHLEVDTRGEFEDYLAESLAYIGHGS